MRILIGIILIIGITSCSDNLEHSNDGIKSNLPPKIDSLTIGLKVIHSPSTVFATINQKDPEKRGQYQLQHSTSVEALKEDLEIVEFGAYVWENNQWVLKTIYDRPFNKEEFIKWYKCEKGILKKGMKYSDNDNWMAKTNSLNREEMKGLWYFIGKNNEGKLFVGSSEIKGFFKLKE